MSYNNNCERFLSSYSYEERRQTSNSLYCPREDELDSSNEFSGLFEAAHDSDWIASNDGPLSRKSGSNQIELNQNKEECGDSFPGSTDVDSEEDFFESQVEAIDELSELFGDDSSNASSVNRSSGFSRPSNPIIRDSQF
eukprot:CAMPEP_0196994662 /NCGR_PEP_ID=MMETSP1380-20130617/918_1 /TAXON_ID=5936 /ORGANISM="Euplotes crassus, Strain CT5" /LENGTH=138 /DNA_ID=CAMNT_0042410099 /DNA_START=47 /DNA_END=463 /DNA_ORIENTATION=+